MKFQTICTLMVVSMMIFTNACSQSNNSNTKADLNTKVDSVSYALGYQYGMFMKQQGLKDLNVNAIVAGLNTGLQGSDAQLTDVESQHVIQSYQQDLMAALSDENLKEGEEFLKQNVEKEGVKETESGLQYKIIKEGDGESPTAESVVKVHYEGRLIDGEVFDSSYDRGEPIEFPLSGVIRGWTEGVQLMKEGAIYEFYIPGNLAYGQRPPQGSPIGPNETLLFKVELIEIVE